MNDNIKKENLDNYITNINSDIYCLKQLPEEVLSVLLSYVSRSSNSFKDNLSNLIKDDTINLDTASNKASAFHEKWTVNYGHKSVAQLSSIPICFDNVSILASKEIQDNRLGAYIEKSTRYQKFDNNSYYIPEISNKDKYIELMDYTFYIYNILFDPLIEKLKREYPNKDNKKESIYLNSLKVKACDILRYLLPTSTYTSFGAKFNAQSAEYMLTKLLSSQLPECKEIGNKAKTEMLKICPTLVKYANKNDFIADCTYNSNGIFKTYVEPSLISQKEYNFYHDVSLRGDYINYNHLMDNTNVKLSTMLENILNYPVKGLYQDLFLNHIISNFIFPSCKTISFDVLYRIISSLSNDDKKLMIKIIIQSLNKHDQFPRCFEAIQFKLEIESDYGSFRDLQRHRMATQYKQILTPYKYSYHEDLLSLERKYVEMYRSVFEKQYDYYYKYFINNSSDVISQYCLSLGWNIRYMFDLDLRQLLYMIQLRTKKSGHVSYVNVMLKAKELLLEYMPILKEYIL